MDHKAKFNHTVGILVNAYFKGELKHGNCYACAGGNIIRGNGYDLGAYTDAWLKYLITEVRRSYISFDDDNEQLEGLIQINASGYSPVEMNAIERAFETATKGKRDDSYLLTTGRDINDEWMFNGLMAVVDVLSLIHGIELGEVDIAKGRFVKV